MKIGILTFHRAINYGAVLQCYALSEVLKGMGHDVEVIDYRPPYIEKYRNLFYWYDFKKLEITAKLKSLCLLPINYYHRKKSAKAFDSFLVEHIKTSSIVKNICDVPRYYDAIIFGSDQIWSPEICEGLDPVFWGQFPKGRIKFVTYAASMGGHNRMNSEKWNEISKMIKAYDCVSVRELPLQQDIKQYTDVNASLVIDPTLLAPRKIFESIAIKPDEEKYVLLFTLEKSEKAYNLAKRIAKERQCKLIRLRATAGIRNKEKLMLREGLTPSEFLGYFKYAEFIVTGSFHGTAFSVIFNKNFYTVHSKQEDRAANLLQSVGLTDRLVDPDDIKEIVNVNHNNTDTTIAEMRKGSMIFLTNSLKNI